MSKAARVEQFFKDDLWATDVSSLPRVHRFGIQTLRLAFAVVEEFRHRLLDARAASLVYTTLLSLVPFLAVMFSVLKGFGVHEKWVQPFIAQALDPLGPKGEEITAQIIGFVNNIEVRVLGVIGVAGLFYTTYAIIDKIEQSLNAIWRVRQGRPWTRKFTDYLSVVLVGPVLVVMAFGVLAAVQSHSVVQRILEIQPLGYLALWAAKFVPFLVLCGVFTFLYKFVPYTDVRLGSALVGGITAAVLWGLAGELFAAIVASSAKYSAIYSSFAILILFLLWLYVGWLIILVGAQMAFFHQHPSAFEPRILWRQGTHSFRERMALTLLLHITSRYLQGNRPYRSEELAAEMNVPLSIIEELVEELIEEGILGQMADPAGVGLVKPPELVPLRDILEAVRERGPSKKLMVDDIHDVVGDLLARRDQAVEQALSGMTLRSLVLEAHVEPTSSKVPAPMFEKQVT